MRKLNKKPRKKNMSTHQMCSSCAECSYARREVLHRRDEEHGRLGDAHREAEDDHRDARPADEAHGVADDMLRGLGDFLEVHGLWQLS